MNILDVWGYDASIFIATLRFANLIMVAQTGTLDFFAGMRLDRFTNGLGGDGFLEAFGHILFTMMAICCGDPRKFK